MAWLIHKLGSWVSLCVTLLLPSLVCGLLSTRIHPHGTQTAHLLHGSRKASNNFDPGQVLPEDLLETLDKLVDDRGKARWKGDYLQADAIKEQILGVGLPEGLVLTLEDVPRAQGGGSKWKLSYATTPDEEMSYQGPSVLQLAHAALGLAVSCSQTMTSYAQKQQRLAPLVLQAKESLLEWKSVQNNIIISQEQSIMNVNPLEYTSCAWREVETTLRGRKSADAAFWFALAGVTDQELFELLAQVCTKELQRFGRNASCRAKDITQMMDRFSAAGLLTPQSSSVALQQVAMECLKIKQQDEYVVEAEDNLLDLHSDRCLLMLWKFSARQKKQQSFLQSARMHWERNHQAGNKVEDDSSNLNNNLLLPDSPPIVWEDCFDDPRRPLVIDVGCGMGISLLGLASLNQQDDQGNFWNGIDHSIVGDCNFLGIDLSGLSIGYAQGVAQRWNLSGRLHFVVDSAETVLRQVCDTYPGPVSLCLIQFPTPYRLPTESARGNSQLPKSALDGFMVSPKLLQLIHKVPSNDSTSGKLLLQSNCEDVALWMLEAAKEVGFWSKIMDSPRSIEQVEATNYDKLPQRTVNWIDMGGGRAAGDVWSALPLLPRRGSTETEVACRLNETPIHRCLLCPSGTDSSP